MRQSPLAPESPSEEGFGGGDVSLDAQQEVHRLSLFVERAVESGRDRSSDL